MDAPHVKSNAVGGRGPTLLAVMWTGAVLAAILVGLRAKLASKNARGWRWDFIWVVLALTFQLTTTSLLTWGVYNGLANHLGDIIVTTASGWRDHLVNMIKAIYTALLLALPGFICSKFSIAALLMDTIGPHSKKSRIGLWIVVIVAAISCTIQFFITMFQCLPVQRLWDLNPNDKCGLRHTAVKINYMNAAVSGVTDIALALFPITIVWHLHMSRRAKIAFCCLMGVGALTSAASFVRLGMSENLDKIEDFSFHLGMFSLWSEVEAYALIILPSIPTLRPLWLRAFNRVTSNFSRSKSDSGGSNAKQPRVYALANHSEEKLSSRTHELEQRPPVYPNRYVPDWEV